jgi:peptide/nickel transport system permease protein
MRIDALIKFLVRLRRAMLSDGVSATAAVVLVIILLISIFGPILPIGKPDQIGFGSRLGGWNWSAPMGTDQLGRSVFARVLQGVQVTFLLSTVSVVIAGIMGALVAITATYFHRFADEIASRTADVMFAFPPILLGFLVVAILKPGVTSAMAVIALITFPTMLRVVRAATLSVMRRDFILVAEISGVSFRDRIFRHLLPNVANVIVVQSIYSISFGMLVESSLSFLGLGVQPPVASLGSLLRDGATYLEIAPWLSIGPGVILALSIMSITLLGDATRSFVDPTYRF